MDSLRKLPLEKMLFESTERWEETKKLEGLLFYAQRLQELSYDKSDFLEKSLSTPARKIVTEILELLKIEEEGVLKGIDGELQSLKDELKEKIHNDPIAKQLLGSKIERYIKSLDSESRKDVKNTLQLITLKLSPERYWQLLSEEVAETVTKNKEKDKILTLANTTFEFLTFYGYEKGTIYHLVNSPGLTLKISGVLFNSSFTFSPTAGTYLCAMPLVNTRSG